MPAPHPHLEALADGGTLLTWSTHLRTGNGTFIHELRFAVRLDAAIVRRLIDEVGAERAVYTLWTYFRSIPPAPGTADSERTPLEEWAEAVEALIAEVQRREP
jgi:hypothetical protein